MDKRTESQFKLQSYPRVESGEGAPSVRLGEITDGDPTTAMVDKKPASFISGPKGIMKSLASWSQEMPEAVAKVGDNAPVAIGGDRKRGRSLVAKHLGLPNKKEFRAKKK